jgi:CDP-diacylglycerol--serine O-phosphatidyltransferase
MRFFVGTFNPPAGVSLLGLCLAMAGCGLAMAGRLELAMVALMWAGLCDLFDGMVARKLDLTPAERDFGVQMDSLVDMASFGVAPVVIGLAGGLGGPAGWIAALAYVCAAAQRLAHFNVSGLEARGSASYYTGLPVTYAALLLPVVFIARRWLAEGGFAALLCATYLLIAVCFLARIPVRKPRGAAYVVFPVLCLLLTAWWLLEDARQWP